MVSKVAFVISVWCFTTANAREVDANSSIELIEKRMKDILVHYEALNKSTCLEEDEEGERFFTGCDQLYAAGYNKSAVYPLWLRHGSRFLPVYCDMDTVGAFSNKRGWMTIQRRFDGKVDFNKPESDYVAGFGIPEEEYWIGLRNMGLLMLQNDNEEIFNTTLRFDMTDWDGVHAFLEYNAFNISDEKQGFKILSLGEYKSSARLEDLMQEHIQRRFTADVKSFKGDKDSHRLPCESKEQRGGWWFNTCQSMNFNGKYAKEYSQMNASFAYIKGWKDISSNNTALRYYSMKLQ